MKISFKQGLANNPWVWDFLESTPQKTFWAENQTFTYNGVSFEFEQPIIRRQRKSEHRARGYAYEEIASHPLGHGYYGEVYPITYTLSRDKSGQPHISDKERVVKIVYLHQDADLEYESAHLTAHLHVKLPERGRMVMKKIKGEMLGDFLLSREEKPLAAKESWALVQAIARAVKEELADKHIRHQDLHSGNILVEFDKDTGMFHAHIIDYGLAKFSEDVDASSVNKDLNQIFSSSMAFHASLFSAAPYHCKLVLKMSNRMSLDDICSVLEKDVLLAPNEVAQKSLDDIAFYLWKLKSKNKELADRLTKRMREACDASTPQCLEPMRQAFLECQRILYEQGITDSVFSNIIMDSSPEKQRVFNEIFTYFYALYNKGNILKKMGLSKEGEQLQQLALKLRQITCEADRKPTEERHTALMECGQFCKQTLSTNHALLDIHRDKRYLFAEIAVIFSCLIVLYPFVAGFHYYATGRLSFYGQTKTSANAEKLDSDFNKLRP